MPMISTMPRQSSPSAPPHITQALSLAGSAPLGAIPEEIAWSPHSQRLYVGNYNDKTLQLFHMDGGKPVEAGRCRCRGSPPAFAARPVTLAGGIGRLPHGSAEHLQT
jgi:hypothetical protein